GETLPKTIQLRTKLPENLWPLMGDATQLHQVLVNLTVNARDAMPEGGVVTLTAENAVIDATSKLETVGSPQPPSTDSQEQLPGEVKPGFYVVIRVSDTGTGIPR